MFFFGGDALFPYPFQPAAGSWHQGAPIGASIPIASRRVKTSQWKSRIEGPMRLVHPWKLTWHWKIPIFNRKYIFKWWIFHCHVSFLGSMCSYFGDALEMPEKPSNPTRNREENYRFLRFDGKRSGLQYYISYGDVLLVRGATGWNHPFVGWIRFLNRWNKPTY